MMSNKERVGRHWMEVDPDAPEITFERICYVISLVAVALLGVMLVAHGGL